MANRLTKILAPNGAEIFIQYEEADNDDLHAVGFIDDLEERSKKFQVTMTDTVRSYSETVLNAIRKGVEGLLSPETIKLEFGIQLGGETGIPFVTKGSASANIKVSIEWKVKA